MFCLILDKSNSGEKNHCLFFPINFVLYSHVILAFLIPNFSCASSFFAKAKVVAVVGEDFPQEHFDLLESKGVDTSGIEIKEGSK